MNNTVYIFDVDGVITDPINLEPDSRVLEHISKLLNSGSYVAFNTGRGYPWVRDNAIETLRELVLSDKLNQLFIAAEMGGVTVEFNAGQELDKPTAFSLSPEHIEIVKQVYADYSEYKNIAWYEGKVSMATIYRPAGASPELYAGVASIVADEIKKRLKNANVKVNVNHDAIDVTAPEAGKWAGAQLIADWLQRTPAADAQRFLCFGDNASDYEMARFFAHQGHDVEFVFTGDSLGDITHDNRVSVTKTSQLYNVGTYDFLATH